MRFTSFADSSLINEKNLSKEEHLALNGLIKNRDLVIERADIENAAVILNKNSFVSRMKGILNDLSKFQKLSTNQNRVLSQVAHMENKITDVLKKLKKKKTISENKHEDLYPVGSRPGILYDRAKINKPIKDRFLSFCPILSTVSTATYKLANFK